MIFLTEKDTYYIPFQLLLLDSSKSLQRKKKRINDTSGVIAQYIQFLNIFSARHPKI